MVGPRPSTHVSCTIGGMIGNNACGSTAQACGKMADSVRRLDVLLYHGLRTWTGETSDAEYQRILAGGGRKADICQRLREIQMAHLAEIRTGYPDIPRRVSGYNLDYLLPEKETAVGKTQTREGARYRRLARCRGKAKAQVALGNTQLRVYPKLLSTPGLRYQGLGPGYYQRQRDIRRQIAHHVGKLGALGTKSPSAASSNQANRHVRPPEPGTPPHPAPPHASPDAAARPAENPFSGQALYRCAPPYRREKWRAVPPVTSFCLWSR
jgi:hypothetical protein